jgi:2'-5' RNA ligase
MDSLAAAADGSHLSGAMVALMPTVEDAARLAIEGGEAADQLHLTLYFLGDDGTVWTEDQRNELIGNLRAGAADLTPISARVFGANHWNAGSDSPSWVWAVGDDRDRPLNDSTLEAARWVATYALEDMHERPDLPVQHAPWVPHICAAYSDELDLIIALEERLGPVTFDRIRVAFAGDHTDIPLETGAPPDGVDARLAAGEHVLSSTAVQAAAGPLRRQPTELEVASRVDFAQMDKAWQDAVTATVEAWTDIQTAQREQITAAVQAAAEADDLDRLDGFTPDTGDAERLLIARMIAYARQAGEQQQAEAEAQGVTVPDWSLDDEAVTAAAFRDRLRQIGRTAARVLGVGLAQSAVRQAMRVWGSGTAEQVAAQVDSHLAGLSGAQVEEQVGAAMTAAQNEGRMAVLAVAPPATYTASEALDRNSCKPCRAVDGTQYTTLADARKAYPTGGYTGCLGGARCRGTLVTVWPADSDQTAAGMILAASAATIPPTQPDQGGTVPYSIVQDHPDCGADTPWAVTQTDTNELMSCHDTEAAAAEQLAALNAAETPSSSDEPADDGDESMDYAGQTAPWRGPLAVEGIVTGDGREFAPEALSWAELPVPLRWNKEDSHGGEARTIAVNVGRIDKIWRDGSLIMGEGVLDLSDDDGRRVHSKIEGKFLRGVSIDADSIADADVEFVWPDDVNAGTSDNGEDDDLFEMLFAQPEKVVFHGGRIRAATLVDIPAFAEAYIALLDEQGAVVAGGTPVTAAELDTLQEAERAARPLTPVTASAGAFRPPAEWFSDPGLSLPTPITVTDDGRIYGHAAQWGSCHIGQEDVCVQPPHEDTHPYYRTGEVVCADGSRVAVGQITVGTGHAPLHYGATPAAEHYDNTGAAVADVAVGNDAHGIWVAGAVRPGADPLKVYELQAAGQVSGDWRRIGGALRLVGLLGVNVPGFPVPKMRARVASGEPQALLAAGRPTVAWGRSQDALERDAVRIVMRMLSRRVHPGRG